MASSRVRSARSVTSKFNNGVLEVSCNSCRFGGNIRDAVKFCKDCEGNLCSVCVKAHTTSMKTKHHNLTEVDETRGSNSARIQDKCKEHGAILVNYCVSHDSLCCHVCVVNYHRDCDAVLSLKRAASGFRGSREVRTVDARLKQLQAQYTTMLKDKKNVVKNIGSEDKRFMIAVAAYRRTINALLDKLEAAVVRKKAKFMEIRQTEFKEYIKACQVAIGHLDNANMEMASALKGTEEKIFVTTKRLRNVATKYEHQLRDLKKSPDKVAFHFDPDHTIEKFLNNLGEIGKVRIELSVQEKLALKNDEGDIFEEKKMTHAQEVNVKLKSDDNKCYITGVTFLSDDRLVIADDSNKKVKVLNQQMKHICHTEMTSAPRDVTAISASELAVTLPDEKQIALLKTSEGVIYVQNKVNTETECYGITCYERDLYVTSGWSESKEIIVLSLDGQVLRKFKLRSGILKCPLYITVDTRSNNILVSDYENGIVSLDMHGTLLNRYSNVSTTGFMGIATSPLGEVFICTLQPNAVLKVNNTSKGNLQNSAEFDRFVSLPMSDKQRPRAITYSQVSNRIVVSFVGHNVDKLYVYKII